ncbi:2-acylglycerol O-acyltransferase 2-A-like [Paramacrobiotus metropolitanus]|uniref:2-acylglycerol O-acyltransferase 2-A-like n=1 Tax=Paramacrobiotus metropolitanus TaxID=2943436 RepID=UPI0024461FA4|nr:2-acylglycerol O-acyltransferase 2-A-like [Paramacrobiotus metropolitanus]
MSTLVAEESGEPETDSMKPKFRLWSALRLVCGLLPYAALYWVATSYFSAWHCKITLLYVCWYLYDDASRKGGRANVWVRRWRIFRRVAEYFPISLEKTGDLSTHEKYIVGSHPHGAYCIGAFSMVGKPITVTQDDHPSPEKVDALHAVYVKELCDLFETHKGRFGMAHVRLKLVD